VRHSDIVRKYCLVIAIFDCANTTAFLMEAYDWKISEWGR